MLPTLLSTELPVLNRRAAAVTGAARLAALCTVFVEVLIASRETHAASGQLAMHPLPFSARAGFSQSFVVL